MFLLGGGALYEFLPCRQVKSDHMAPQNELRQLLKRRKATMSGLLPLPQLLKPGPRHGRMWRRPLAVINCQSLSTQMLCRLDKQFCFFHLPCRAAGGALTCVRRTFLTTRQIFISCNAHASFVSHRVSPAPPCQLAVSLSEAALRPLSPEWLTLCLSVMV